MRAVAAMSAALLAAAVLQGVFWARVAPGTPYQVRADGFGALPTTTNYRFVAAAVFALSGLVIGTTAAVAAWSARHTRGLWMLVTLVAGSLAGAWLAWGIGAWLAPGTDPAGLIGADPTVIVVGHPTTGTWLVTLAQPTAAAAVYTVLAAWNGVPDLGVRRPGESSDVGMVGVGGEPWGRPGPGVQSGQAGRDVSADGTRRTDRSPGTPAP